MTADAAIAVKKLCKSYREVKAVDGLELNVQRGEFFGFLGPNGAGKTTTIRMLAGLIPPDQGEIAIGGFGAGEREKISRLIGVVPESRGFYDWMTAYEYLSFFASLYGLRSSRGADPVPALLDQVGLKDRQHSAIGTYSRGMRQRLGLARALLNNPQILLLDEPTLGLDPQGQEDIQNLLRALNRSGVTIFLSSHLLHEVSDLCSRIAIIAKGRLVVQGTLRDLQQKADLKEAYAIKIQGTLTTIPRGEFASRITREEQTAEVGEFVFEGDLAGANALIDRLRQQGIPVLEFRPDRDNLTEIFLSLTQARSDG
jgi:ABC-2 type transport system ATP-binding protein